MPLHADRSVRRGRRALPETPDAYAHTPAALPRSSGPAPADSRRLRAASGGSRRREPRTAHDGRRPRRRACGRDRSLAGAPRCLAPGPATVSPTASGCGAGTATGRACPREARGASPCARGGLPAWAGRGIRRARRRNRQGRGSRPGLPARHGVLPGLGHARAVVCAPLSRGRRGGCRTGRAGRDGPAGTRCWRGAGAAPAAPGRMARTGGVAVTRGDGPAPRR
jgi:hypothetical protein